MSKRWLTITCILLLAVGLRLALISVAPPGLTHDEADHGLDAWGVVGGIRPIYFTVGYGREPFFDYATAILMAVMGPSYLAGRLISVFFSLILVASTYTLTKRLFTTRIALLTSAFLTVNFWAIMTSRHALRSVTMPALFTLSLVLFFQLKVESKKWKGAARLLYPLSFILSAFLLGGTFYTYMPARITWAVLPTVVIGLILFDRQQAKRLALPW